MNSHDSFVKGESSSEASGFSSVEASTPNPQHQPLAFVKAEVYQEMNVMDIKDEAPQVQGAPRLADTIAWEDRESKDILKYNLHRRLRYLFFSNKKQVDLRKLEPFEATDSDFGNWTSHKILQFFASVLPHDLLSVYKLFKFPSQLIEHLHCRDLYIENQECQVFWYELIGLTDEMYDGVLESLWKLKYGCEDGYQRWKGKEHQAENMDVGREEVVSYERKEEGKEEDQAPGLNEEEEETVEEKREVHLDPNFFQGNDDATPGGAPPVLEQKIEQKDLKYQHIQEPKILDAQENFLLAPAPTAPTIGSHAPAPNPSEDQQGNRAPAPAAASMQRVLEMAAPVAHPADLVQAPPQVRPPPDAFRLDAERLSELVRLGILAPPPPAHPARIEVQAPLQIVEQQDPVVLAPAIPDAPPVVWPPLQGGWQQGLGVPAPVLPDAPAAVLAPLQEGWHQAPGYWAPPPQAASPAIPAIPDAWIPRQEGAYGRMPMLCMAMQDLRRAQFQAVLQQREQLMFGMAAPAPPVALPIAQHAQGLPQGVQQILSPPLPAPAPIDQHLGVQAALRRGQHQFPGFQAPPPAAVPPMAPFAQDPPLYHPPNHLILVPRDGQPYAPPPYRPL